MVDRDGCSQPDTTVDMPRFLRPVFARNRTVMAINASDTNDGAARLCPRPAPPSENAGSRG
ncbi:hypothetical protein [uncultured Jatrophihabitans sp.]|uniref:thiolase family protein n=1 Tax=uncultured Jatrophihabitans sp. TaxID=1610747 RepID=UPI0035CA8833